MRKGKATRGVETHALGEMTVEIRYDGSVATVLLNGVESSAVDTAHPEHLDFEYMQHMTAIVDARFPEGQPLRTVHLGAAACALPWAWDVLRPGSRQTAVEVNAQLAHAVRTWFDLPRSPALKIRVGDGRAVCQGLRPDSIDVVVRDAFQDGAVPTHMVTVEATQEAYRALAPGGLYVVNSPHGSRFNARPDLAAIQQVFDRVAATWDPKVGKSGRIGNIVVVGQKLPSDPDEAAALVVDFSAIDRGLRKLPLPARIIHGRELTQWCAGMAPVTDAQIHYQGTTDGN